MGVNSDLITQQQNATDPFLCTFASPADQSASPCNEVDDENWSRVAITSREATVRCVMVNGPNCGNDPNHTDLLESSYSYTYYLQVLFADECNGCQWSMYWGNQDDADKLDYYNAHFVGFMTTDITAPDGAVTAYYFNITAGYGVENKNITCTSFSGQCAVWPWQDGVTHGRVTEEDDYDTHGGELKQTLTNYTVSCPSNGFTNQVASEEDVENPVVACEIETASQTVYQMDDTTGNPSSTPSTATTYSYVYDGHGHLAKMTTTMTPNDTAATPTIVSHTWYAYHDAISQTSTSANGPYLANLPGIQDTEDGSSNVKACTYFGYDGGTVGADNSVTTLTKGLQTESIRYAGNCTPGSLSGPIITAQTYNSNGDLLATQDADALGGVSGHTTTACQFNSVNYTACATYDSVYDTQVASVENVKNQTTSLGYLDTSSSSTTPDPVNGWGQWRTSMTDANGQKTNYEYDSLGRLSALVKPGDSYGSPTASYGYPDTCNPPGPQTPCIALTTAQRLSSSVTYQSQTYYDGWGNPTETVSPESVSGSTCTFTVSYTLYDASQRTAFVSVPYFQTVSNDASCTPVYMIPDASQPGTATTYDGLGRTIKTKDPLSNTTLTTYTPGSPTSGANITDTAIYEAVVVTDANSHQTRTLTDALGHTRYVEQFTGTGQTGDPYTLYGTTQSNYDYLGDVTSVYEPSPSGNAGLGTTAQTQTTYNLIKEATAATDADRGRITYAYDPNGNLTIQTDPRGSSDTTYIGYDGLNRVIWRNTTNSPTGAYVTDTYDQTSGHGDGVGHLTTESYTNSGGGSSISLSGSHAYTYDTRGEVTSQTDYVTGHPFTFGITYNDAGQQTSLTYSDNEVLTSSYNNYGWLTSVVTTPSGQGSTNLLSNITYSGVGGAAGHPTGASVGNGTYTFAASYDNDGRLSSDSLTNVSSGQTLYQSVRGYDNMNNVASVATTLTAGMDNQAFCYDALNRLTWAGSTGTPSCGGSITAGTITGANYTQTMSYDPIGRLTNLSTNGSYTYGDSAHTHAATAIGSVYQATYDAAGDMTCRAPGNGITCTGSNPNGQTMAYSNEQQLAHWQNTPSSPLTQDDYLYDGEGQRVMQYVNVNRTITTTAYLMGGAEESTAGVITKYLGAPGLPGAVRVGSTLSYLMSDGLGSVSEAFDTNGNETAAQLYAPYGTSRYATGSMPTSKGFTGQRTDVTTGLDYYSARYYDPSAGQFATTDSAKDGLSPYAYVKGNPETLADPSGHCAPLCSMLIGAGVGFMIGFGGDVLAQSMDNPSGRPDFSHINWGKALEFGAGGAVAGAIIGLSGPGGLVLGEGVTLFGGTGGMTGLAIAGAVGGIEGGLEALLNPNHTVGSVLEGVLGGSEAGVIGAAAGNFLGSLVNGNIVGMNLDPRGVATSILGNAGGNMMANAVGQWLSGQPFNKAALLWAGITGGLGGIFGPAGRLGRAIGTLTTVIGDVGVWVSQGGLTGVTSQASGTLKAVGSDVSTAATTVGNWVSSWW